MMLLAEKPFLSLRISLFIVLLAPLDAVWGQNDEQVQKLVELVLKAESDAENYQLATSAQEYEAKGDDFEDFGKYDFIVIGAGSTGSVVANRLSEIPNWNILVLEAGDYGNNVTDIPYLYFPVQFSDYNWGYHSVSQTTACQGFVEKKCPFPRGKGVGGSSLINTLVYARGHKSDFNKWAAMVNDSRWNYENVLPYFKKSENFVNTDPGEAVVEPEYHGEGGYLTVDYYTPTNLHLKKFLQANEELGVPLVDHNANKLGASVTQINTIDGRRLDNGKAFIKPVVSRRANLKVLTRSLVTKIRFEDKKAVGVEFNHGGRKYFAGVTREIVLSAGAFGSAQILMLSGVGPKNHLQELEIDVVEDLEVGSMLIDHPTFYGLSFSTNFSEPQESLEEYAREFLDEGVGPLAAPNNQQGLGFYESSFSMGTGIPDIELLLIPPNATNDLSQRGMRFTDRTYEDVWGRADRTKNMNILVIGLHSKSIGKFRLKSSDPLMYPLIDPRFLSDPEDHDIQTLYDGVEMALKLSRTPAFKSIDTQLQSGPLRACSKYQFLSKKYWFCALRQVTSNLYHPSGTCRMGKNRRNGAVVDSELRVFGIEGLRVADASVFPMTLAGHPNAVVTMVGEVLGDLLKHQS